MFVDNLNPVLYRIGPWSLNYYGLTYVIGFTAAYFLLRRLVKERHIKLDAEGVLDYVVYLAFGAVIGARLFYCLVYNPAYYLADPLKVLYIWNGGMSFHGGLIGAVLAGYLFCRSKCLSFLEIADITMIPLAFGLFLGRIANFVNGELVGRVTNVPWCFRFPRYDDLCRHPSQLYESAKNLVIFFFLIFARKLKMKKGILFALFLLMYSVIRFFLEFFRQPDEQIGFIYGLTMGQILCILMFLVGLYLYYHVNKKDNHLIK